MLPISILKNYLPLDLKRIQIKVSLIEYENEHKKREKDSYVREAILIIGAAIIGAIVGAILV